MTDEQFTAHCWLSRMWDMDTEVNQLLERRETILSALSGIGKYDDETIHGGSDPNPTETKNIEYSVLSEQIEKRLNAIAVENIQTLKVIDMVPNTMLRGMLKARYINRKSWTEVGRIYNYERSQAFEYRKKCLDAIYPFIPKEVIINGCNSEI